MKSRSKRNHFKYFILTVTVLLLTFLNNNLVIANKDENQPVLDVEMITDTSVLLNWDLEKCDLDCNTYHLSNFISWELYQKNYSDPLYFLVFTTSELWETSTTIIGLEANSRYFFYIKLYWDWSNLHPDIAPTYGRNYTSNKVWVQTLSPGETQIFIKNGSDDRLHTDSKLILESSLGESLSLFPSIISLLVVVPVISLTIVIIKRKLNK